jgi:hypothetical protein
MVDPDGTLVWSSSDGLRCLLLPFFGQCQLRLLRDLQIVKTEVFDDEARAMAAARKWRRTYSPSARSRSRAARANLLLRRRG